MCVTTLLHLAISQGVYRTDFCPRTPLTNSLLDILPKIAFETGRAVFWSFSGYMSQNVVYRSSTSQSYARTSESNISVLQFGLLLFTFSPQSGCRVLAWLSFGGIGFGKAFRILALDGREVQVGNFGSTSHDFAFTPASMTEFCSFWNGLKVP